jgi:hypothetical protein
MLLIYSKQKTTGSPLDSVLNKNDNIAADRDVGSFNFHQTALTLFFKKSSSTEYKKVEICTKKVFLSSCFN